MTQLEDLLRQALSDAPTPEPSLADPLPGIRRAARRRHALLAGLATAAVAAVAVVVPAALTRSGGRATPAPLLHSGNPAAAWESSGGVAVASGGGSMWSLDADPASGSDGAVVVQHDPATGRQLHRWSVPGPVQHLAFGLGRVWAYGATEGPGAAGMVAALDPATGVVAARSYPALTAPFDMAFAAGSAWVTLVQAGRLEQLAVDPTGHRLVVQSSLDIPGQPSYIQSTGDGALWVDQSARSKIVQVLVGAGAAPKLGVAQVWSGKLLAPVPGSAGAVWSESGALLVAVRPGDLGVCASCSTGRRLQVHGLTMAVAVGPNDAVFAAVQGFDGGYLPPGRVGILAYAPGADLGSRPLDVWVPAGGADVRSIAVDPAGGVVYATSDGRVGQWLPKPAKGH